MSKIQCFMFFLGLVAFQGLMAQHPGIHSHNDYEQDVPFWGAYANKLNSIEVDIFLKRDSLFATHSEGDIIPGRTIESLYLQPIQKARQLGLGSIRNLQLLVDVKSEAVPTLKKLIAVLNQYPDIVYGSEISIVISGNRPAPDRYLNYPEYIKFDYQSLEEPDDNGIREKIALISLDFNNYSGWNGKGRLTAGDYDRIKSVIDSAHAYGKPFRFWGAPDSKTAWKAFKELGIDFINTDAPYASSAYLNTLEERLYQNSYFSEPYRPKFETDLEGAPVKNVILLIGDGNGLGQISSSVLANGGELSLTQIKNIGLLKTQSADDFTTDSAAAGTALATGEKTNNRFIGVDKHGKKLANITEILSEKGFSTGFITTDAITGATPAAFYAHRTERSDSKGILSDLLESRLVLFVGGGSNQVSSQQLASDFTILENVVRIANSKEEKVCHILSEGVVPGILDGRSDILSQSTKSGLAFLSAKGAPFFLMVEGAKIDSYAHENKVSGIVAEGIDFDRAVSEALKFADSSGNTLVIVTADHETSGFSIPQGNLQNHLIEGDFTTHDHTATMVPLFAYGPGSNKFQGVYENTMVFHKLMEVLGIE